MVEGDSVSLGSVNAGVVCKGGSAVNGMLSSGREGRRSRSGLTGECLLRELGREEVFRLCGLGRGEWSTGARLFFCGEKVWLGRLGSTAPLLARLLVWLTDVILELVE
jgi:hypothetical protein